MAGAVEVGVVVNTVGGYSRGVLRGLASYATSRAWRLRVVGVNAALAPGEACAPGWAGVVVQAGNAELAERFRGAAAPVVNVSSALAQTGLATVVTDDLEVGRLAAEHLLGLKYRRLAFYGPDERAFVKMRRDGFARRCAAAGAACLEVRSEGQLAEVLGLRDGSAVRGAGARRVAASRGSAAARLLGGTRGGTGPAWEPIGVMGCNDRAALGVLEVCRSLGLRVPEDVAVVGVDDDDLVQSLASVPLSTVWTARERVGFEAGAMLERMMRERATGHRAAKSAIGRASRLAPEALPAGGEGGVGAIAASNDGPPPVILVPPSRVVARRSTDATAIREPDVAEAMRFIRTNAGRPITVSDVVDAVSVSRRQLERKFRGHTGQGVLRAIVEARLARAQQLLTETDLTLDQVARGSGYTSKSYFCAAFRRQLGGTPQWFREQARGKREPW